MEEENVYGNEEDMELMRPKEYIFINMKANFCSTFIQKRPSSMYQLPFTKNKITSNSFLK